MNGCRLRIGRAGGLENSVTHRFRVPVQDMVGVGPATATPSGTTVGAPGAPGAPARPTVTHPAPGSLPFESTAANRNRRAAGTRRV